MIWINRVQYHIFCWHLLNESVPADASGVAQDERFKKGSELLPHLMKAKKSGEVEFSHGEESG